MVRLALLSGLALLQAIAVRAVIVPAGLPAGLYSIPFDANGDAIGEPILLKTAEAVAERSLSRRQQNARPLPNSQEKCGTGGYINVNNFAVAKELLQSECDYGDQYGTRTAIVFTNVNTIAYFCTYDTQARCWRQEMNTAMDRVVASCGYGNGGESYVPSYSIAYGGDNVGQQICRF
ncbi:hypothetical protein QBC33DRAFT_622603 [Phialemonium atrogriseum]|uniref:Uncharacterized protein n=1 Tax=Phialemonium atrogriseum TaxID=1093897 RepID=A0AAJ0BTB2_9PEZI|nr:uncharacterized protein QBC33DRAFT_622603 [Phialemonium atrogriseum]KAK1763900.1 hypothetical protein QBC33DRAFT_622603 [Phialemonium atrogriseum]